MIYFGTDDNNCKRFEWDNNKMIKCNKGHEIIAFKSDTRGSFAINADIAVGDSIFIGASAMCGAGLVVRLSIAVGGLVAIGIRLAGEVLIYYIEEGLERLYGKFKEFIFE